MSAYAGSLVPASTPYVALDRLPLILLLGALFVAFAGHRLEPRRRHAIALVSIGMALGLLGVHAAQLFNLEPSRRALRDVTTNLVRIGSFDANLGFFLDPTTAMLLLVLLASAAFFLARTKFVEKNAPAAGPFQASLLLLAAGVPTALLADGFVGLLLGLSLSMIATFGCVSSDDRLSNPTATASRLFQFQIAASAILLTGFVLLFWTLGGSWPKDGYLSDFRARFVPVYGRDHRPSTGDVVAPSDAPRGERDVATIAQRAKARGSLTFLSHPGTRVFIDVGDKVLDSLEPFATTPFVRKELSVGPHEVVIVPGGGAIVSGDGREVAWIERLDVRSGEDVAIVAVGQTTTFSEIDDQVELVDDDGKHFLRNALFNRTLYGALSVVPLVVFLATLGALLFGAPVLLVPWFGRVSSTPTWNIVRIAAVVLALVPLVRLRALVMFHLDIVLAVVVAAALLVTLARTRRPAWILGAAALTLATLQGTASAKDDAGHLTMRPEFGDVVELDYAPDGETMLGGFVVRNDGSKPVQISGARLRGNETVRHSPPFATVELDSAKGEGVIVDPGKQRRVVIRWRYSAARAREFFGHVFVETNAECSPSVLPVHATRPRDLGPFGDRILSFILGFPLLATLLALVLRLLRRDTPRFLAGASGLVFGVQLAFIVALCVRFDKRFGHADGNEGLQFIERSVLSPKMEVEWFLGVDGISLMFIVITSIAAFLAAVASWSAKNRVLEFHVWTPVLISSAMGIFLARDLFLFCFFWFVGIVVLTILLARSGEQKARRVTLGLGAIAAAGAVFLGASAHWLHGYSDPSYLVNGRFVVNSWSIPDLARVDWMNTAKTLDAPTGFIMVWTALFVAFVSRIVTLGSVFAFLDAPRNVIVPVVWGGPAIYGLLRLNLGTMPVGLQWAAKTVVVVGIAIVAIFSALARLQTNLRMWIGHVATAYAGFALVGLGSCTPQGIAAAVHVSVSSMLGLGLGAMLVSTIEQRLLTVDGTLVALGIFSLAGFWGPLLAIVGVFPRGPVLALMTIVAWVFLGITSLGMVRRLFGGAEEKAKKQANIGPNEWVVIGLVVLVVLGLGFAPRTLFSLLDTVILDLHRMVDAAGALQVG